MDKRCPLNLSDFPCEPCVLGENLFKTANSTYCKCKNPQIVDEELLYCGQCKRVVLKCPWGINSKEHNYCFWSYLDDNPDKTHNDSEIAKLIGLTVQRVGQIVKNTFKFLRKIDFFENV